ncbi:hypothetical protein H4CHR_04121 [Variovorax sp. PBS-H4]|uniref:DUF1810 domain-containing protein n=1 Tax=Variovorax sp. PBS-H4 TaxID=434008 RepID=UPI0013165794|nr:DUF1810 domain-containing protein [Variovorax sp. PBS-H4]VTU37247.1 hypothetical protein H4CHR_04121 [Variovorax sp. PBS-H4]
MNDAFELHRFVDAQAPVIDAVRAELRAGRKRSHWMWFVFPQLVGLGRSAMAQHYAIASLAEARAYLAHPLLGPRLRECSTLVLAVEGRDVHQIFGAPDDLKFCSSMTLFEAADPSEPVFRDCLHKYFGGSRDRETLVRIEGGNGG